MPRIRRVVRPGRLIHIIIRFLNHEHLLSCRQERGEYLRRVASSFGESDWQVLSYVLMSTHVHFGAIAGTDPFGRLSQSLHAGFAGWLNPRRQRLGPIVASRPSTWEVKAAGAGRLIAYHHNNPIVAGVVESAAGSNWSSHRSYVGYESPPSWLHVDAGLRLAGFDSSIAGRLAFDTFVSESIGDNRFKADSTMIAATRRDVRAAVGSIVELSSPVIDADGTLGPIGIWSLAPPSSGLDVAAAVKMIAQDQSQPLALVQSKSRRRDVVRVRRIAVLCLHALLGAPLNLVAANLGISAQAAHQLERSATQIHRAAARRLAPLIQCPTKT